MRDTWLFIAGLILCLSASTRSGFPRYFAGLALVAASMSK